MRIVVALGGNALLRRGQKPDADVQEENVRRAVTALAPLADGHELVMTHGNGPQVGVLALQSASDPRLTTPYPFDVLGAQTQGMIGYWLLQGLQNRLSDRHVAAVINQTLVDVADPAFADPTKFVGETYDRHEANRIAAERDWVIKPDGAGWRRVVPSPHPRRVVETALIRQLIEVGAVVVCAGGGGVPVVRNEAGDLEGVEAVVDKDRASALLAIEMNADLLMIPTGVERVAIRFGAPDQQWLDRIGIEQAERFMAEGHFGEGSMRPKIEALLTFVKGRAGGRGVITNPENIARALRGETGTWIER